MSSLFPFLNGNDVKETSATTTLPIPKEYAWDFEKDEFLLKNGKMQIVERKDAVKVWAYKALKTDRFKFRAYSWDYGNEFESLIGSRYSREAIRAEVVRYIKEALSINPYIVDIRNVQVEFNESQLNIQFRIVTIYGEVDVDV
jgi:hypothetical protein